MVSFIKKLFGTSSALSATDTLSNELAWLTDTESLDDVAALNTASKHLAHMLSDPSLALPKRIDQLTLVHQTLSLRAEKLALQYAKSAGLREDIATSITDAAFDYYRQSFLNFLHVVERILANPKEPKLEHNALLVNIANALDIALNMVKWRYFEQAPAPAKIWLQVYSLYEIAIKQNILDLPIQLANSSKMTRISNQVAAISLFGNLAHASMQKQHFQITVYLLKSWLNEVSFSRKYDENSHLFVLDTQKDFSAKRTRHFEKTLTSHFWHIDAFEAQITQAITSIEHGKLPPGITLTEIIEPRLLLETLQVLLNDWSKTQYVRQRRKEIRSETHQNAAISHGFLAISNQIEQIERKKLGGAVNLSPNNKSLDERLSAHSAIRREANILILEPQYETWAIKDESPKGLGVVISKQTKSWLKVGKLIGMATDERPPRFLLTTVRSLSPSSNNQDLHVGLEVIARFASWGNMQQVVTSPNVLSTEAFSNSIQSTIDMGFIALYLPIEAGLSEESTLILPKLEYRANETYEITIKGRSKTIKLGQPIDAKDDWVRLVFPHVAAE